ncbi:MAG: hypothetical protein JWM99_613, partial [Verrucomicrobiales bacterium]|nr:hypothetical protein [Verrucomicrobiales bacterium]
GSILDGLDDLRIGMTEDGWSPRADVINDLISVQVEQVSAFGTIHKKGRTADGAEGSDRGIDPPGDPFQGLCKKLFGFFERKHGQKLPI